MDFGDGWRGLTRLLGGHSLDGTEYRLELCAPWLQGDGRRRIDLASRAPQVPLIKWLDGLERQSGLIPLPFRDVPDGAAMDLVLTVCGPDGSFDVTAGMERRGEGWSIWGTCDGRMIASCLTDRSAVSACM